MKQLWTILYCSPHQKSHTNKLEDILKALLKNGLKISPKKCQLFKASLQYMGNEIFIENKKVCVKPLTSRLEAIQKLQPSKTPKGYRSFAGVVNFLSMFCLELQKLLKPKYGLTRKAILLGKGTAGLIYRNKVQINKASGIAHAK